jgi:V/A-type H+-transporting ATPase subunit F
MRVFVLADHLTCMAFALAGIEGRAVKNEDEAAAALEAFMRHPEVGLILVTERIASTIRHQVDEVLIAHHWPLIVEIPDSKGPLSDRLSARERVVNLMGR